MVLSLLFLLAVLAVVIYLKKSRPEAVARVTSSLKEQTLSRVSRRRRPFEQEDERYDVAPEEMVRLPTGLDSSKSPTSPMSSIYDTWEVFSETYENQTYQSRTYQNQLARSPEKPRTQ